MIKENIKKLQNLMKEKGIETAIEAIESINKESNRMICTLDIYGRIDEGYKDRFK